MMNYNNEFNFNLNEAMLLAKAGFHRNSLRYVTRHNIEQLLNLINAGFTKDDIDIMTGKNTVLKIAYGLK